MAETIAILSDSLLDLDKKSTDYMIIEEQLKMVIQNLTKRRKHYILNYLKKKRLN